MAYFTGIKCDKCGARAGWVDIVSKKWVDKWARKDGWTIGNQTLCPNCKRRKKTS